MSQKNTPSLHQFLRNYSVNVTTANASYTAPTNTGLLWTAGPDGSEIWEVAAAATANQTNANQLQLFTSSDFGSTFSVLPITGTLASGNLSQQASLTVTNLAMPNSVPMGPSNPLVLGGIVGAFTHTMAQSLLTEAQSYYAGAVPSGGSANAQTLSLALNTSGTQLGASPANGAILDFTAGLSNSGAFTIQPGAAGNGVSVTKPDGTALAMGDIVKGFRYRLVYNSATPAWVLLPTQRIYCAVGQSQAATFTAWGADR